MRFRFQFENYHEQWNPATGSAADFRRALYRTRQNFEPEVTFVLAKPLTLSVGRQLSNRWKTSFRPRKPRPPTP